VPTLAREVDAGIVAGTEPRINFKVSDTKLKSNLASASEEVGHQ
jgi:hypothetical protein